MQALRWIINLLAAALVGIVLDALSSSRSVAPAVTIATLVVVVIALGLQLWPYLPRRVQPSWRQVPIELDQFSPAPSENFPPNWINQVSWRDIFWLSKSRGWLAGAVSEGGGHDDVGLGALLFSYGGPTWNLVPNEKFNSGEGAFTWGPEYMGGGRPYRWTDVGPIQNIRFYQPVSARRTSRVDGWAATATGIYRTTDAGQTWQRSTPAPDSKDTPERFAFYFGIGGVEGFQELYATGWQGITHSIGGFNWDLQKPTYFYYISAVAVTGGSENRNVWAVGLSGHDELGRGDRSRGAIYHLAWPRNQWEMVSLPGVHFEPGQGFKDLLVNDKRLIVCGDRGLVVRGILERDGTWNFRQIGGTVKLLYADEVLSSIAEHEGVIYIVGQKGSILYSRDDGLSWTGSDKVEDAAGNKLSLSDKTLNRIRFFNNQGWILGTGIVLKSVELPVEKKERSRPIPSNSSDE